MLEDPLDRSSARDCGVLLARTRTSGVADAAVALLARPSDIVLTSDPEDFGMLPGANHSGARVQRI
jgi:predicted nucleic acid-binding protein